MTATKTIRATVSNRGVQKVGLLFNHNPRTIFDELLQNARRAKATMVDVEITKIDDKNCRVTLTDNGRGIDNPQNLLTLFDSGWDEETGTLESPAGMGFFSLCHLPEGVEVHSQDWRTHIDKSTFEGRAEAEVEKAPRITGTRLTFQIGNPAESTEYTLKSCVEFYPVKTRINRKDAAQKDFLDGATHIMTFEGGRIGVFTESTPRDWPQMNFHGLKVPGELPCPEPRWAVRADIQDNRLLDLVLPSRNAVVENFKWAALKAAARKATYELAEKYTKGHDLSYSDYKEAHSLGIKIPEARAELSPEKPTDIWGSFWSGPVREIYDTHAPQKPDKNSLVSHLSYPEVALLHLCAGDIPLIFAQDDKKVGYSWYPQRKVTELVQKLTWKDGTKMDIEAEPVTKDWEAAWKKGRPSKIEVSLKIEGDNKREEIILPARLAANCNESGVDELCGSWLEAPRKKGVDSVDTHDLKALFFSPSDDYESDSHETQSDYFLEQADDELVSRRKGSREGYMNQLTRVLNTWDVTSALRNLGVKELTITFNKKTGVASVKPAPGQKAPRKKN